LLFLQCWLLNLNTLLPSFLVKSISNPLIMYATFFPSFLMEGNNSFWQLKCAKLQCNHASQVTILGGEILPCFRVGWGQHWCVPESKLTQSSSSQTCRIAILVWGGEDNLRCILDVCWQSYTGDSVAHPCLSTRKCSKVTYYKGRVWAMSRKCS
jgi:hypothetical protein